jgi:protein SCO1
MGIRALITRFSHIAKKLQVTMTLVVLSSLVFGCSDTHEAELEQSEPMQRTIASVQKPAPVFTGTDQLGQTFSSASLKGKKWIASFFFTSCQTVCPRLNNLQMKLINDQKGKVVLVSVSTDPSNDHGQVLADYAEKYKAQPGEWWMINMKEDSMRSVSRDGFGVIDPKEPTMHTTRLVAVNEDMMITGYYDSEEPADVELLKKWISSH